MGYTQFCHFYRQKLLSPHFSPGILKLISIVFTYFGVRTSLQKDCSLISCISLKKSSPKMVLIAFCFSTIIHRNSFNWILYQAYQFYFSTLHFIAAVCTHWIDFVHLHACLWSDSFDLRDSTMVNFLSFPYVHSWHLANILLFFCSFSSILLLPSGASVYLCHA